MSEIAPAIADGFAAEAGTVPVVTQGVDASAGSTKQKFYSEEDIAKARTQEKNKLYPEIEALKAQVETLAKEKEEREARKAALAAEKEQAELDEIARKEQEVIENELSAKDLLKLKEREWKEQLERERQERELAFSLLEKERALSDLQQYRNARLAQEADNIIPELSDLVMGNTREEVDASLADLVTRSNSILENARAQRDTARREMQGTKSTLPPTGPLETNSESTRQLTAQEIAQMDMGEYAKYRNRILSDQARGRTQGMFS
jgi:hypothetical protein